MSNLAECPENRKTMFAELGLVISLHGVVDKVGGLQVGLLGAGGRREEEEEEGSMLGHMSLWNVIVTGV